MFWILPITGMNEGFEVRAIHVAAHDTETLSICEIELSTWIIDRYLLRGMYASFRYHCCYITAQEAAGHDAAVVYSWSSHIGPEQTLLGW
jgi:hypothetical protein